MTAMPVSPKLNRPLRDWQDVWHKRLARELEDMEASNAPVHDHC